MKTSLLATAMSVALMGGASAGFRGNAAPPPHCVIADSESPTNVRTRANGVIIGKLNNGRIIDQVHPYDGLWDFVMELSVNQEEAFGWVYDKLIRCQ
jgi:hypothetical protein